MKSEISEARSRLDELKGSQKTIQDQLDQAREKLKATRRELHWARKAHAIIQQVAQQTQEQLRYQLSELPKLALSSVFDDPYDFDIQIETRRGRTEVDFWFVREGQQISPRRSSGLGAVDIAGMALRPALWSLQSPRNRPTLWLDEPFKHLKGQEANQRALAMLAEICRSRPEKGWPGIQIVMVADERLGREDLLEVADCVYEFSMKGRQTVARRLK